MKLVYEVNGSDIAQYKEESGLMGTRARYLFEDAKDLAKEHGVPLSDVSMRFVEE